MSAEPNPDAKDAFETALCAIHGIADVMTQMGMHEGNNAVAYLAGQLLDAYELIDDAYCRAYQLNEYSKRDRGAA